MYILNLRASDVNHLLPHSNLSSFDSFKTETLYEISGTYDITLYSDRLRSYKNYSSISKKHGICDIYSGIKILNIQNFLKELLSIETLKIIKINVSIDGRGYPIYGIMCEK